MKHSQPLTVIVLDLISSHSMFGTAIRLRESLAADVHCPSTRVLSQQGHECAFEFDVRVREELLWAECRGRRLARVVLVWGEGQAAHEVARRVRLACELMEASGGELVLQFDPDVPGEQFPSLIFDLWRAVADVQVPEGVTIKFDGGHCGEEVPECLLRDSRFPMDTIPSPPRFDSAPASGVRLTSGDESPKASKDSEEAA